MSQATGFDRLVIMSNPSQTEDRTIERKTAEPLEITNLLQTATTIRIGGPRSSPSVTNFACDSRTLMLTEPSAGRTATNVLI
jgi:hypothetical protein